MTKIATFLLSCTLFLSSFIAFSQVFDTPGILYIGNNTVHIHLGHVRDNTITKQVIERDGVEIAESPIGGQDVVVPFADKGLVKGQQYYYTLRRFRTDGTNQVTTLALLETGQVQGHLFLDETWDQQTVLFDSVVVWKGTLTINTPPTDSVTVDWFKVPRPYVLVKSGAKVQCLGGNIKLVDFEVFGDFGPNSNTKFFSKGAPQRGIIIRSNKKVVFRDCTIDWSDDPFSGYTIPAYFVHDYNKFEFRNCRITNSSDISGAAVFDSCEIVANSLVSATKITNCRIDSNASVQLAPNSIPTRIENCIIDRESTVALAPQSTVSANVFQRSSNVIISASAGRFSKNRVDSMHVNYNRFEKTGGESYIINTDADSVDARYNYWGDACGPPSFMKTQRLYLTPFLRAPYPSPSFWMTLSKDKNTIAADGYDRVTYRGHMIEVVTNMPAVGRQVVWKVVVSGEQVAGGTIMTDNNGDITFSFTVPARHKNALAAVVDVNANQCITFHELISIKQSTLPDLSVNKAQIIQVQQTTKLVAGKPLAVKVQIGLDRQIINAFGVAVAVNGDTIRQFYKFDKKNIDKNFDFISPQDTISLPDGIPAIVYLFVPDSIMTVGKYNLDIIVDPAVNGGTGSVVESNEDNNVMSIPVEVVETRWGNDGEREMSILFQTFDQFSAKWIPKFNSWADSAADFIRNVYPLADDQLKITKVDKSFSLPPVLTKDSLTEEEWQEYIVNAYTFLRTKYPLQDRIVLVPNIDWFSSGRFDQDSFSHRASVGLTYSGIQDMFIALPHHFKTVAHELGHTFGLHRADFGDAEEYHLFFIGVQVYDGVDAKSHAMKSFGTINSWNQTQEVYCFMSNGALRSNRYYWIDQKDYEKLLAQQQSFTGIGGMSKSGSGRSILISGVADWDTGTLELDPFTIMQNAKRSPSMSSQSEYVFIAKAADGTEINRFYYQPTYTVLGLDESGEQAPTYLKEHFAFVMPFPISAKSITVEKNGKIVITRTMTSNKPVVEITYPKPGTVQGDRDFNITWTGNDPDGDNIWYNLYFSENNGITWKLLAYRTTETSFPMKIAELDNRNTYLVKLEFSDGFNYDSTVMSGPFSVNKTLAVDEPSVALQPHLSSNYPNPFSNTTTLNYYVPRTSQVRLEVFDALGRVVRVLVDGSRPQGTYTVRFNPGLIPPGVYIVRFKTPDGILFRRMIYSR